LTVIFKKTRHAQLLHVVSLALFVILMALIFDSHIDQAMNANLAGS
jgi:hypothetical protein